MIKIPDAEYTMGKAGAYSGGKKPSALILKKTQVKRIMKSADEAYALFVELLRHKDCACDIITGATRKIKKGNPKRVIILTTFRAKNNHMMSDTKRKIRELINMRLLDENL